MKILRNLLIALMLLFLSHEAYGACTVQADPVDRTFPGVAPMGYFPQFGTISIYVTCPSGQEWTLKSNCRACPTWMICKNGSYGFHTKYYLSQTKAQYNVYDIYQNTVLASGVGTGSPQLVTLYTRNDMEGTTWAGSSGYIYGHTGSYLCTDCINDVLSLTAGEETVYASLSGTITVTPSCVFSNTTNMTMNFDGQSDSTGSFSFTYFCGQDQTNILSISGGNNPSGEVRQASKSDKYIKYRLYSDSSCTNEIGINSNNSRTLSSATSTVTIYGKVLASDIHDSGSSGAYTDVVVLTITY